jgi:hypothetical protein
MTRPSRHLIVALVLAGTATAAPLITTGDLPGTNGRWQQGEAIVNAPPLQVQTWLSDYGSWPDHFDDVIWTQVVGTTPDGRRVVRFRSRILERTMTIRVRDVPNQIDYEGEGPSVTTQGKIFIQDVGGGRTRVLMQTTANVHGALGAFVTEGMKRDRARKKLRSDLASLVRLSGG